MEIIYDLRTDKQSSKSVLVLFSFEYTLYCNHIILMRRKEFAASGAISVFSHPVIPGNRGGYFKKKILLDCFKASDL